MGRLSKTDKKILVRAAEIINTPGVWIRGWKTARRFKDSDKVCALGAVRKAREEITGANCTDDVNYFYYRDPVAVALAQRLPGDSKSAPDVIEFNDSSNGPKRVQALFCRTVKEEVDGEEEE